MYMPVVFSLIFLNMPGRADALLFFVRTCSAWSSSSYSTASSNNYPYPQRHELKRFYRNYRRDDRPAISRRSQQLGADRRRRHHRGPEHAAQRRTRTRRTPGSRTGDRRAGGGAQRGYVAAAGATTASACGRSAQAPPPPRPVASPSAMDAQPPPRDSFARRCAKNRGRIAHRSSRFAPTPAMAM